MQTFITIMGWLVVVALSIAILASAVSGAAYLVRRSLERYEWAIIQKAEHELGRKLDASAHWFGESPETAKAIESLAKRLIYNHSTDPDEWRKEWRQMLLESKFP